MTDEVVLQRVSAVIMSLLQCNRRSLKGEECGNMVWQVSLNLDGTIDALCINHRFDVRRLKRVWDSNPRHPGLQPGT